MAERDFDDNLKDEYLRQLVERYERMLRHQSAEFFDEEEFEDILDYFEGRNELAKALEATELAISRYQFNAWFLVRKAQYLTDLKQYTQALDTLEMAEILDPGEVEIYLLRGEVLTLLEKYRMAVATLLKGMEFANKEERVMLYNAMSEVYDAWEQFDKALFCLRQALNLDPSNEEVLYKIWFLVDLGEHYEESVELHKELIDKDPYNFLAWYNLGHAYFGLEQYEEAAEAFEYVILINEEFEMAYRDRAEALYRLGSCEEAIKVLEQALDLFEPYEEWYFTIALCYEKLDKPGRARQYYRKAILLDPYFHEAYYKLGLNYRKSGKLDRALHTFRKALRLNDQNFDYLVAYASALLESGDQLSAIHQYEEALRLKPTVAETWVELAEVYYQKGQQEQALETLRNGLKHCGYQSDLLYTYAAYLLGSGHTRDGQHWLSKALQSDYANRQRLFRALPGLEGSQEIDRLIEQYNPDL